MPDGGSPRYLGRRHSLTEVDGRIELRDRLAPDAPPVRFEATPGGWEAAIAELRLRDGDVLDTATGALVEPPPRPGPSRGSRVAALLLAVALAATVMPRLLGGGGDRTVPPSDPPTFLSDEQIVDRVRDATILVVAYDGPRVGVGSGWVYDASRRLIVTNAHVVDEGTTFRAGVPGTLAAASLLGQAPCEDLAVLQLSSSVPLRPIQLAPDDPVDRGARVAALGYPPRLPSLPEATQLRWTFGSVSHAHVTVDDTDLGDLIEHTARLDPGNSGGPLVDERGRVIGVNVGVEIDDPRFGLAIPIARVRAVIPQILSGTDVCAA